MFTKEGFSCSLMLATRTVKNVLWFRNILQQIQKQDIMSGDLRLMKDNNKLKIQIKGKQTNKKL